MNSEPIEPDEPKDEDERRRRREEFLQEAEASEQAYRENGRHLTGEETRAWLRTWGTAGEMTLADWHHKAMAHMKRMATDEEYRREIAKRTH